MPERLLDSVILKASAFILGLDPAKTAVSVISYAEILVGFNDEVAEKVKALLAHYKILIIDKAIAEKAAALRRSYGWKLPDAFQAALAIFHHLRLCTRNTKDFDPQKHTFVEIPYVL